MGNLLISQENEKAMKEELTKQAKNDEDKELLKNHIKTFYS